MKKCKLNINEKEYLLELNRESIKWLEMNKFDIREFESKPVTYYDMLWNSLFIKNHKDVDSETAMKLLEDYETQEGSEMVAEVIKFAVEQYAAFMNALVGTNSKKSEKKLEIID